VAGNRLDDATLTRSLGFWQVTVTGIGIVIGAGIYVLIGEAAKEAGGALWIAFVLAATLSALTGLSYAELAGMFPRAGAEYEFARRAFNEFTGFLVGWTMIAANLIAAAAVAIGFAQYFGHFFDANDKAIAIVLLAVLTLIIASGIQRSIWLTIVLAVLQVGGLLLVIAVGLPHTGNHSLVEDASVTGVFGAASLVFFAFIGFDEVVTLSEETRDASRVIPRALLAALAISTVLYVLVGIAAVSVVGADALASSDRPLALVMEDELGGRASDAVAFIALASTMNTSLMVLTAASRLTFGMSRSGALPAPLARLGPRAHAPYVAAIAGFLVASGFTLVGGIGLVASVTDFAVYVIFIAVNAALIALRRSMPDAERPFRTPGRIGGWPLTPILGIATVVMMLVFLEPAAWLLGTACVLVGVAAWWLVGPPRRGASPPTPETRG
jgi:APA family basic amino acid/polyamine antiporter